MSVWKPSEGLLRAEQVVARIQSDLLAVDRYHDGTHSMALITPVGRYRMVQLIAEALDQALSDGAEQATINAMVGNGHTSVALTDALQRAAQLSENDRYDMVAQAAQELSRRRAAEIPLTADPVGVDLPDFPAEAPAGEALAEGLKGSLEQGGLVVRAKVFGFDPDKPDEAPKKKRGRPKGSKAKKKAKAPKTKADPAPVAESATTEPEAPAGEAAS